jgi:hypothetical protein
MASADAALLALVKTVAAGDRDGAGAMLKAAPALAHGHMAKGAARQNAQDFWLAAIDHYIYAGDTALHIAAAAYQAEMAKAFLRAGADVRARNRRGAEPLHYACDSIPDSGHWNPKRQASVIAALLAAGADPDALDDSGVAPLHRAVRTRCSAAVKALLEGGARAGLRNRSGSTPMDLATKATGRGGSGSAGAKAEQAKIIALLEARSASLS